MYKKHLSSLIACLLAIPVAMATTVIPPTFEELADKAELVFVGQMTGSHAEWRTNGARRVILTFIEFKAEQVWKGEAASSLTLQFLGGTIGDTTLEVAGVPQFAQGERVILFVQKNGRQYCPLVGVSHGKFGVRKDGTGRDVVVRHDQKPLRDIREIGAGDGAEFALNRQKVVIPENADPVTVDAFKELVQQRLAAGAAGGQQPR